MRTCGDQRFLDWKMQQAQEKINVGQWKRTMELSLKLKLGRGSKS